MGLGGFINLVNGTTHTWRLSWVHSYQMEAWDGSFPATLAPGQQQRCYVEVSDGFFEEISDDAAEVNYTLDGTPYGFQLQMRTTAALQPSLHGGGNDTPRG